MNFQYEFSLGRMYDLYVCHRVNVLCTFNSGRVSSLDSLNLSHLLEIP